MNNQNGNAGSSRNLLILLGILWLLLAAAILFFQFFGPAQIAVDWTTETEFETAGFNIFRATTADGEFVQINNQLLPSEGDAARGASYSYLDNNINQNITYYYKLEEVEYDNSREFYDLGSEESPVVELWAMLLAAVGALVGLFLLVTAFKQENSSWMPIESQNQTPI